MRTITQAAVELGVSRTKIYNEIEKLDITTKRVSKNNFIDDSGFEKIKGVILNETNETLKTSESIETPQERLKYVLERDRNITYGNMSDREYMDLKDRIAFLQSQIDEKDKQLSVKDEQIHAKDNQINGLIQSNLNFTKALNPPLGEVAATVEVKKGFFSKFFRK